MRMFAINLLLAVLWALMLEDFTVATFAVGFVCSYLLLWFLRPLIGGGGYFRKVPQVISFSIFMVREIVKANLRVAWHIVTPSSFFKPGIVAIPLEPMTNFEATMLANMVTLTPGSFSVDISSDRKTLYVHMMDIDDVEQARRSVKHDFERRLLEVLR